MYTSGKGTTSNKHNVKCLAYWMVCTCTSNMSTNLDDMDHFISLFFSRAHPSFSKSQISIVISLSCQLFFIRENLGNTWIQFRLLFDFSSLGPEPWYQILLLLAKPTTEVQLLKKSMQPWSRFPFVFVCMSIYVRVRIAPKFGWDDFLITLSLVDSIRKSPGLGIVQLTWSRHYASSTLV